MRARLESWFESVKAGSVSSAHMKREEVLLDWDYDSLPGEKENLLISVCLCSVVYSTQHRSVWKYRRRWSPAGLPVPDPGSLFSRQRLLALGMAIHNDCKEPFWAFTDPLTLLMAGSNLVQCVWKATRDFNQHCLCWDGNFLLQCLSSCKYIWF